ncbi:putative membrane protein [Paramagnetospirillum magnetotacticum MS-1]|uniref:Putative membrane protein n=1 Tax=Paramagnetospirillum magnetotacticum MS-1 TaxID=272627 RepID=A0A0C2YVX2_PARME|nr:YdcF family protein [Paramagnetospirillum magnetotacticum]KIL98860.1 putative membrane protein [Paramagnetospirillum magnetotacticum MS-1]
MFLLSKLLGFATDPATVFLLLILLGGLMTLSRRWLSLGRKVLGVTLLTVTFMAVVPLEYWAETWMEARFRAPNPLPEKVDGIIVLGGAINPVVSEARGQVSVGGGVTRMTTLIPLAKRYPEARLVFSGGSGSPFNPELREADYAKIFYDDLGFDTDRIVFERDSRNTRENATLSKELMQPRPGETWLLITSAGHMPRSVGCFRAVGWPVVPIPVDYYTTGLDKPWWTELRFSPQKGIFGLAPLIHEGLGLVMYRLMGWTDTLLPKP